MSQVPIDDPSFNQPSEKIVLKREAHQLRSHGDAIKIRHSREDVEDPFDLINSTVPSYAAELARMIVEREGIGRAIVSVERCLRHHAGINPRKSHSTTYQLLLALTTDQ